MTPHLSYCDVVWGGTSKKHSEDLQKTGNFAAKSLLGLKKRESATYALSKLNMMTLDKKREVHLGVLTHKLLQGKGPEELVTECQRSTTSRHHHQTRSAARRDMRSIAHRTTKSESSFSYRAAKCWNSIPPTIRDCESTSTFKKRFQSHLLSKYKSDVTHGDAI